MDLVSSVALATRGWGKTLDAGPLSAAIRGACANLIAVDTRVGMHCSKVVFDVFCSEYSYHYPPRVLS